MDFSNALTVPWWVGVAGPPLLYGLLLVALLRRRTPERIVLGATLLVVAHAGLAVAAGAAFAAFRQEPFERALFDALGTFVHVPLLQLTWLPLMILPVRWVLRPPRWARKRRAAVKSARPAKTRPAPPATSSTAAVPLLTFVDSSAPRQATAPPVAAASARGIIEGRADVLMIEEVMPGTFSPGGAPAVTVAPPAEPSVSRGTAAPTGARGASAGREPLVRVPFERVRSQLPASAFVWSLDAIAAELHDPHHLLVPRSVVVPQLGEGAVKVGWEVVADQFPRASLAMGDARIAAALPGGVFQLPLDEVIRQVPPDVFDLPAASVLAARDIEAFPEPFRRASADDAEGEDGAPADVDTSQLDAEAAGIDFVEVPALAVVAPVAAPVDAAPLLDVETLEPLPEPPVVAGPSLADPVAAAEILAAADPLIPDVAFEAADDRPAEPAPPADRAESVALDDVATPAEMTEPVSAAPADPFPAAAAPLTDVRSPASAEPLAEPAIAETLDIVEASRPPRVAPRDLAAAESGPARFPAAARSSTHATVESLLAALEEAELDEPATPVVPPPPARPVMAAPLLIDDPALLGEARRAAAALAPLAAFELSASAGQGGGVITLTAGAWTGDELTATARQLAPLFGERSGLGAIDQITLRGSEGGAVVTALEPGAAPTVLAVAVEQSGALALLEILSRRAAGEAGTRPGGAAEGGEPARERTAPVERIAVGPAVMHRLRAAAAPLAPLGPLMPSVFRDGAGESRLYVFAPPASDVAAIAGLARALCGATSDKVAVAWFAARLTTGALSVRRLFAPAGESAVLVVWDEGRAPRGRVHRVVERAARGLEEE